MPDLLLQTALPPSNLPYLQTQPNPQNNPSPPSSP